MERKTDTEQIDRTIAYWEAIAPLQNAYQALRRAAELLISIEDERLECYESSIRESVRAKARESALLALRTAVKL